MNLKEVVRWHDAEASAAEGLLYSLFGLKRSERVTKEGFLLLLLAHSCV